MKRLFIIAVALIICFSGSVFAAGPANVLYAGLDIDSPKGQVLVGDPTVLIKFILKSSVNCFIKKLEAEVVGTGGAINDFSFFQENQLGQITVSQNIWVNWITTYAFDFDDVEIQGKNSATFLAGGTFPAMYGPLQVVIRQITAVDSDGNEMKVEGLPLSGNPLTFTNCLTGVCSQGQIDQDGKCISVPPNPPELGYPINGAIMGIPQMDTPYMGMIPFEVMGIARSYIEIQIASTVPIVQAVLDDQFINNGWVMTATAEKGNYFFLIAGPRPFGEVGKSHPVLHLNFQAAGGPMKVGITGAVDGQTVVTSATFTLYKKGDVNLDGDVSSADAMFILNYLISLKTSRPNSWTIPQYTSADVNWDGQVNVFDAIGILQLITGVISSFDQLSGMGAPPKTPKSFGIMVEELAIKGAKPEAIAILNQLAPVSGANKLAKTWGKIKIEP